MSHSPRSKFDTNLVVEKLDKMWSLGARFGQESEPYAIYLEELVSDRFVLCNGMHVLRDELSLSYHTCNSDKNDVNVSSCSADFKLPSIICTLAYTGCGDRVDMASAAIYEKMVASRFASISELGEIKPERFNPTGGGTDDGSTLAAVTIHHQIDNTLRERLYEGNTKNFILVNFDLKTHCGKISVQEESVIKDGVDSFEDLDLFFGQCRESMWREARSACGAIVGCLRGFDPNNHVHVRIRKDLGEENFEYLSKNQIYGQPNCVPVTFLVAAAIVSIQGMINTAKACAHHMDEREVAHLTASVSVNSASVEPVGTADTIIYLARATAFQGEVKLQGLGTDATKYTATINNNKVLLTYNMTRAGRYPVETFRLEHEDDPSEDHKFETANELI